MKFAYPCSEQKSLLTSRHVRSCLIGSALLVASAHAQAHTFCVSSAAELQGALDEASDGGIYNGENNIVLVVKGTYMVGSATSNGPFHYHSTAATGQFRILGGYNAACTLRTKKASLTVLDGNGIAQVLSIRRSTSNIAVIYLTIQNGETNQPGGGLMINPLSGDDSGADIENNIIRNNHTSNQAGGLFVHAGDAGDDLYVLNNVITGNSADFDIGAGAVIGNSPIASVYNNTVTRNTTALAGGTGGLYYGGAGADAYIANNIFWNNTTYGIYLTSSHVHLDNNDIGTAGGFSPVSSTGNISLNPRFVDAVGGDFHLAGDSPLLGAFPLGFANLDPDGNGSPTSGKVDCGAYNETIFIDGFDGN